MPANLPRSVWNWLTSRYLADPTPGCLQVAENVEPEPVVLVRYEDFADFLVKAGIEILPNLNYWENAGWIVNVEVMASSDPNDTLPDAISRLNLPLGRHRLVGIRASVLHPQSPVEHYPDGFARINLPNGQSVDTVAILYDGGRYKVFGDHPDYIPVQPPAGDNPYKLLRHALSELHQIAKLRWLGKPTDPTHANELVKLCHQANRSARQNRLAHGISDVTCDKVLTESMSQMMDLVGDRWGFDPNGGEPYNAILHRLKDLELLVPGTNAPSIAGTQPAGTQLGEGGLPAADRSKGIPLAEAEIRVRDWLAANAKKNPAAITRDAVAIGTGVSAGQVSKTAAWKAFRERRNAETNPGAREVPLTDAMHAIVPSDCKTPDELAALLEEQRADEAEQNRRHKRRHKPS